MDTSKLEKIENKKLPLWIRAGNFIDKIGGLFDKIEGFLIIALTISAGIIIAPFSLLFEIIAYIFRKK